MRRILIVANKMLSDENVLQRLAEYMAEEPCRFYILVPAGPRRTRHRSTSTRGESRAVAGKRLFETLQFLYDMGADAAGKVSDQPPLRAIAELLLVEEFDEILLSTLPPGTSTWLSQDLPRQVALAFALPVTHVAG
jgi:GABA permease